MDSASPGTGYVFRIGFVLLGKFSRERQSKVADPAKAGSVNDCATARGSRLRLVGNVAEMIKRVAGHANPKFPPFCGCGSGHAQQDDECKRERFFFHDCDK